MRKFTVVHASLGDYIPSLRDPELTALHARNCDDGLIAEKMKLHPGEVAKHRARLGLLPITVRPGGGERVMKAVAPLNRKSALDIAIETLPGFNAQAMTLDGAPKKLPELMQAVNRQLKRQGLPQCDYNRGWLQ